MRGRLLRCAGAVLLAACAVAFGPDDEQVSREHHFIDQVPGYDISWPQCPGPVYPPGQVAYTIVGINGGRPFTPNPCFIEQYRWAQRFELHPAVYINMDYPRAGRDEPAKTGPYGTCQPEDEWCRAYNYGYANGADVVGRAQALGITPEFWWLDVETGNHWSNDPTYNAQAVRGTLEYFWERELPVGIYSTPRQWGIIAGPYAPGVPVWTAGAQGIEDARNRCFDPDYAFAGGQVAIAQFYDHSLDTNYRCPDGNPMSEYPYPDPYGRVGPYARSLSLSGTVLPMWFPIAMIASD